MSSTGPDAPLASSPRVIDLLDGDVFTMTVSVVRKRIGAAVVPMLSLNGSIPGPTLRVPMNGAVTVRVRNSANLETTIHWHGVRLENRFDGVPHDTQAPIGPNETFAYQLRFPDAGVYWYHPHMREDYAQEMGLYGAILVLPDDAGYWPTANRELSLMLDDILMADDRIAPFGGDNMGRFGNVYLVNGETSISLDAASGEVIRLYLTNVANVRNFDVAIPGAVMKLIGADLGRCEREEFVDHVLLSPGERSIVDVLFDRPGFCEIQHRRSQGPVVLGTVAVTDRLAEPSLRAAFNTLRTSAELEAERAALPHDYDRPPDRVLELIGEMPQMSHGQTEVAGRHVEAPPRAHEAVDHETMHMAHGIAGMGQVTWKLVDQESGAVNNEIDWTFTLGARAKVRLINPADADHPMSHPFHVHGQRFLVLSRDRVPNLNLAWKDTVLVESGETVDILIEMSNPGTWMAHCHIAEHAEAGMMFTFHVSQPRE